jgi:hypothetical protein
MSSYLTAGLIDDFLDSVQLRISEFFTGWFASWFGWLFDPLIPWYAYGAMAFAAALVIGWFFPFRWVRAVLGFLLLLVASFIAGGKVMHDKMKPKPGKRRR